MKLYLLPRYFVDVRTILTAVETNVSTLETAAEELGPPQRKVESPAATTLDAAETAEVQTAISAPLVEATSPPVVVQPPAMVHTVAVEDVTADDIVEDAPASEQLPMTHVAAKWPFVGDPNQNTEKVSLNVNNTDVRTVFEMLARGYQMNILVSPDVVGTLTANIEGLTAEETLRGVLKMCNLKAQEEDGLIFVYPGDGLPA